MDIWHKLDLNELEWCPYKLATVYFCNWYLCRIRRDQKAPCKSLFGVYIKYYVDYLIWSTIRQIFGRSVFGGVGSRGSVSRSRANDGVTWTVGAMSEMDSPFSSDSSKCFSVRLVLMYNAIITHLYHLYFRQWCLPLNHFLSLIDDER